MRGQAAVAAGQRAGRQAVQVFKPKKREAAPFRAASHLTRLLVAEHDRRAGGGHRAVDADRQETLADKAAILGPGGQLLPHIAALLPVDAVQLVETALEQNRLFDRKVAAAVG